MNSEQEENDDHVLESNVNSSSNVDQTYDQKSNGPREHAKPRRRRRGKKRKQKKDSAATCETENPEECESDLHVEREPEESEYPDWDSDENLSCGDDAYNENSVILRPVNVPSAPLNSTQFIIDDHNDCRFYMSFETPNPYVDSQYDAVIEGDIIEPIGDDAAYIDIDYQYESPQDFDNSAYYDQDFELSYKNNRFEDLLRLTRPDLINRLKALESRLKELSESFVKENPSPILEKLQTELLELQEKNSYLKESNVKLSAVLQSETDSSEPFKCQTVSTGETISSVSQDEQESEDSDRDYQECSEPEEVIMSDFNDPDILRDISDKDYVTRDQELTDTRLEDPSEVVHHSHPSEVRDHYVDHGQVDEIEPSESSDDIGTCPAIELEEVGKNQHVVHSETSSNRQVGSGKLNMVYGNLNSKDSVVDSVCSNTAVHNSEVLHTKSVHSNSSNMLHCQPNNHVKDDLRTLSISTSELLHITNQTKCSSLVPVEGGMSPSETSVN